MTPKEKKRQEDLVERYGDWCQTYTGIKFHPLDPQPEDFNIEDIAHALSNLCRFNGHCTEFYSVAQHSVLVSIRVEEMFGDYIDEAAVELARQEFGKALSVPECKRASNDFTGSRRKEFLRHRMNQLNAARWGLLHDAAEAYLSDVPRPLKRDKAMEWFRLQEGELLEMIAYVFDLGPYVPEVGLVDMRMLLTEKRDIMVDPPADWMLDGEPYELEIACWAPTAAEIAFLQRFKELGKRRLFLLGKEQEL